MRTFLHSPWLAISLGISGLILGYAFFITKTDSLAAAWECPVPKNQVCENGDCDKNPECASGECGENCPGNCQKNKTS